MYLYCVVRKLAGKGQVYFFGPKQKGDALGGDTLWPCVIPDCAGHPRAQVTSILCYLFVLIPTPPRTDCIRTGIMPTALLDTTPRVAFSQIVPIFWALPSVVGLKPAGGGAGRHMSCKRTTPF